MNQQGSVSMVNTKTGMAAIQLEDGTCTLVDLLGSEPVGVGDTLEGARTVSGEETLINKSSGRTVHVFIHAYQISLQAARDAIY